MRTTLELSLEALYVSRGDPITAIYTAKRLDQNGLRSGVVVVVEPSVEAVKLRAWKDQFDERLAAFLPIAAVVEIIYITPATAMKLFSESARAAFAIHPALERLDGIVQQTQYQ